MARIKKAGKEGTSTGKEVCRVDSIPQAAVPPVQASESGQCSWQARSLRCQRH